MGNHPGVQIPLLPLMCPGSTMEPGFLVTHPSPASLHCGIFPHQTRLGSAATFQNPAAVSACWDSLFTLRATHGLSAIKTLINEARGTPIQTPDDIKTKKGDSSTTPKVTTEQSTETARAHKKVEI